MNANAAAAAAAGAGVGPLIGVVPKASAGPLPPIPERSRSNSGASNTSTLSANSAVGITTAPNTGLSTRPLPAVNILQPPAAAAAAPPAPNSLATPPLGLTSAQRCGAAGADMAACIPPAVLRIQALETTAKQSCSVCDTVRKEISKRRSAFGLFSFLRYGQKESVKKLEAQAAGECVQCDQVRAQIAAIRQQIEPAAPAPAPVPPALTGPALRYGPKTAVGVVGPTIAAGDPAVCSKLEDLTFEQSATGNKITQDIYNTRIKPLVTILSKNSSKKALRDELKSFDPPGAFMSVFKKAKTLGNIQRSGITRKISSAVRCPAPNVGLRATLAPPPSREPSVVFREASDISREPLNAVAAGKGVVSVLGPLEGNNNANANTNGSRSRSGSNEGLRIGGRLPTYGPFANREEPNPYGTPIPSGIIPPYQSPKNNPYINSSSRVDGVQLRMPTAAAVALTGGPPSLLQSASVIEGRRVGGARRASRKRRVTRRRRATQKRKQRR